MGKGGGDQPPQRIILKQNKGYGGCRWGETKEMVTPMVGNEEEIDLVCTRWLTTQVEKIVGLA